MVSLIQLYLAKKVAVFLAARAYGFKPLYRRCLEANNRVFTPGTTAHAGVHWAARHTFDAALRLAGWMDARAIDVLGRGGGTARR